MWVLIQDSFWTHQPIVAILMVAKDMAAFDATHNYIVHGARCIDTCFARHVIGVAELWRFSSYVCMDAPSINTHF